MSANVRDYRSRRTERLGARVPASEKALLQHAADLTGQTLSEFVLSSAREAAEDVIRRHEVIVLSALDSKMLAEALLAPQASSDRLKAAFEGDRRQAAGD